MSELIYKKAYDEGLITRDYNYFCKKIINDTGFEIHAKKYDEIKNNYTNMKEEQKSFILSGDCLIFIIFFIIFGLRYILYITNWSIKQLKE